MKITRTMPEEGWVPIANAAVRDDRLSWRARGLLAHLLSYPDGWKTNIDTLVAIAENAGGNAEGRDAMRAAMQELEDAGYVTRTRYRDRGRWAVDTEVIDRRSAVPEKPSRKGRRGSTGAVGPASVDPAILETRTRKTDTKKDLIRGEGMDAEQPESGEGRGTRKGTPEVDELDGWPVVASLGEGWGVSDLLLDRYND